MKIYDFPLGARGLRSTWLCEEMNIPYEFIPVSFPPDDAYRTLSPTGRVPHLVDADVSTGESIAMMLHIVEKHGGTATLLPAAPVPHARALELAIFGEASLAAPMDVLLMVRYAAPPGETGGWVASASRARLMQSLDHLDKIAEGRPYLVGDALTIADISIATALRIWSFALKEPLSPGLQTYVERLQERPAYRAATARWAGASN